MTSTLFRMRLRFWGAVMRYADAQRKRLINRHVAWWVGR